MISDVPVPDADDTPVARWLLESAITVTVVGLVLGPPVLGLLALCWAAAEDLAMQLPAPMLLLVAPEVAAFGTILCGVTVVGALLWRCARPDSPC